MVLLGSNLFCKDLVIFWLTLAIMARFINTLPLQARAAGPLTKGWEKVLTTQRKNPSAMPYEWIGVLSNAKEI